MEDKILDLDIKRYKNLIMIDILYQSPCITPASGSSIQLYHKNNYIIEATHSNSVYADTLFISKDNLNNKIINKEFSSTKMAIETCNKIKNAIDKINSIEYRKEKGWI
mgnify:CR=1 FL=1